MNELDFWREEPSKKAKAIANEIEHWRVVRAPRGFKSQPTF